MMTLTIHPGEIIFIVLVYVILGLYLGLPAYFGYRRVRPRAGKKPSWGWPILWLFFTGMAVIPNFAVWRVHTARAKSAEAKTNLGAIYTVQLAYHTRHHAYAGGPNAFKLLNWEPVGEYMYAYYCGADMLANTKGEPITQRPGDDWPYPVLPGATATVFTCVAVGNVDNDPYRDAWTINEKKELTNPRCDLNDNGQDIGWVAPLVFTILTAFAVLFGVGAAVGAARRGLKA